MSFNHNAQSHRRTDRQSDRRHYHGKSRSYWMAKSCVGLAEEVDIFIECDAGRSAWKIAADSELQGWAMHAPPSLANVSLVLRVSVFAVSAPQPLLPLTSCVFLAAAGPCRCHGNAADWRVKDTRSAASLCGLDTDCMARSWADTIRQTGWLRPQQLL